MGVTRTGLNIRWQIYVQSRRSPDVYTKAAMDADERLYRAIWSLLRFLWCMLWCRTSSSLRANFFWQLGHRQLNGFSPESGRLGVGLDGWAARLVTRGNGAQDGRGLEGRAV